ncbi:DNA gyrase subunit A [Riemerella anatipestifer]|uniref:DNA gyrase subunit A n=1 Tax=Riemerella anatipestifer TaxID=34085 RepID=UPI0001F0E482|nr:DNA gyrase subunit A [Riemerella anatipestifer]AGC40613.1 Type IIA topoisomerase (DNA gyrase/topo II, topoisomerase IV), A subunit [Riemerella anatipestifer RA-CH-2]AKP68763.1 Type IIA topoisomerase (DNA gyrase/topo II, topoisomerase IV), A subunit [Riemerella anatipestifer]AKP70611.1 Type IIA topoisomerase (DNA gyrase/topo II, topoisomerase IV), A subunit [Riemerella anatipestifer]AKQ39045.1 DNA gyrase subunit A [Riemerella anatipestifer Yb2]EFT35811.1 DNA gyrase subunit A [Riemerella anat
MHKEGERLIPINIVDEMKSSYIDYSMSVIVSRALPDVRDGLKPVHRRVLYGMYGLGVFSNKKYLKSARIVGDVLGKYHPHGDISVYDAMVRMAQPWSLRYPQVDGQGNFGSMDGDPPAAMRYTEARLKKISDEILSDLDKETVDFQNNFDDSLQEPTVLPTKIPNLLVNGTSGIAVGMATNMAPHNLSESVDAICAYIDNKNIEIDELMKYIIAPDFPTGGIIYGYDGVRDAFHTGRGRIVLRAKVAFEEIGNRNAIIVTEIPYLVNKAEMIARTSELVKEDKIQGIHEIRDESDRRGMRVVYELKNDAIPNVVLNLLYKYTALQTSFSVNNIALVKGRPQQLNLKDIIVHFVEHRHEIVIRRTQYELKKARERAHILEGFMKVIATQDTLDKAISIIRHSATPQAAKEGLIAEFELSDIQAQAILDLRLARLTGMELDKIRDEYKAIMDLINDLEDILANEARCYQIIKDELLEVKEKYGDERRTEIDYSGGEMSIEDFIPNEEVVLTISHAGYIKRTLLSEYKTQSRGGVGNRAASTRDEDFLEYIVSATNHQYMLFFTEKGKCYWLRVFEIPEGSKTAKGRAIQNLINIEPDDKIKAYIRTNDLKDSEYVKQMYVVMITKNGTIKKTSLEAYSRPRTNGIHAIEIREDDQLLGARLTNGNSEIMIATKNGKCIRFPEEKARAVGRTSIGVRGISLEDNDEVIGMIVVNDMENETVLVVSEKGYGKRTAVEDYRVTNRGGKGVITLNITEKTGQLIAIQSVVDGNDLMIINKSGVAIRMSVDNMRVMGRNTQGVRLINLKNNDEIAAVAKVEAEKDVEDEEIEESNDEAVNPSEGNSEE